MKLVTAVTITIICLFLTACLEQEKVVEKNKEEEPSQSVQLVFAYLKQHPVQNKYVPGPDDLMLVSEETDHLGMTHVKFQQIYQSVPVWSKQLFAHLNKQNEVFRVDQNISIIPEGFTVQAKLSSDDIADYAVKAMQKQGKWQVKQANLMIYISPEEVATLAYYCELNNGIYTEFVMLSAQNGALLHQLTGTYTQ